MTLFSFLVIVQIILALVIIVTVLLQQGKGAEAGAALSGSSGGGVLSPSSGAQSIVRFTALMAFLFILNSLVLAMVTPNNSVVNSVIVPEEQADEAGEKDIPSIPLPQ